MSGIPRPQTVRPSRLADLAVLISAELVGPDAEVSGVTHASGEVQPGDLYAALPGSRLSTWAAAGSFSLICSVRCRQ